MIRIRPIHPLMLVAVAVATVFTIYNETFWGLWSDVFDGNFRSGVKFVAAFFLLCCALLGTLAFHAILRPLISGFFLISAHGSHGN